MTDKDEIHFIAMTGAGREAEHAPMFANMDVLKDWLYGYAKRAYEREHGAGFESAYEVDEAFATDRWRAAVEWASETGRGEWAVMTKAMASIGPGGEALNPQVKDCLMLDEDLVESLAAARDARLP